MKWIKFSESFPAYSGEGILVYDGKRIFIGYVYNTLRGDRIFSDDYYCNDPECTWIYDDCCCSIQLNENCWWMSLPKAPDITGYEE